MRVKKNVNLHSRVPNESWFTEAKTFKTMNGLSVYNSRGFLISDRGTMKDNTVGSLQYTTYTSLYHIIAHYMP